MVLPKEHSSQRKIIEAQKDAVAKPGCSNQPDISRPPKTGNLLT